MKFLPPINYYASGVSNEATIKMLRNQNELMTYIGLTYTQRQKVRDAFIDIIANGNTESKNIARTLANSFINLLAQPGTGTTNVFNVDSLNRALSNGSLHLISVFHHLQITFDPAEINQPINLQGLIVHEGHHALVLARIISTLATGNPSKYENETRHNDEIRAKKAAGRYLRDRGGTYTAFGKTIGIIDPTGKSVILPNFIGNKGTIQDFLKALGVRWKT